MNEKIIGAEEELYLAPQTTESAAVSNEGISLLCDTENNSMQTAADITFKNWIQGQITCPEEEQWYRFTANGETAHLQGESGRYVICTAGEIDVEGYLYNSAGQQMVYNNRLGGLCIIDDLEYNQTYYLCIKSKDGNIGSFCVKADYMSATESGAYMESAIEIPFIADTVEDFCCPEHMIWYKFTADVPVLHKYAGKGKYSICGVSPESLIKGTLYTSSLNRVEPFYTENYAASFTNYYMLDEGETYYLLVSPSNGKKGRFRLNVTYDLNTSDNGNCMENAIPIMINNWQDGSIDVARQSKWYVFTVDGEYDKLTIHSDSTIRLEGELYDKDENFITSDNVYPEPDDYITQTNFEIVRQLEDSATYYVCVTGIENNTGTFRIRLTDTMLAESISIEPKAYAIEVGETLTLQPVFVPKSTSNKTLNWVSSDPSIASVNSNGVVTGKSHGNTRISATTTDGTERYDYCYVSVGEASEMVGLSRRTANLNVGESLTLTATVLPPIATVQSVNWTVSPQNVLRIDASDETTIKVTALAKGTATITAKTNDTYVSDSCEVTVSNYCGGSNYKDVTQHTMELQDGYYVCSKCGYRVKSPEIEDNEILSTDDYLMVVCCNMHCAHIENLIQTNPSLSVLSKCQDIAMQFATIVRQQQVYTGKYEYSDNNGKCVGPEINYDDKNSIISKGHPSHSDIIGINDLVESIHDYILGYFCPSMAIAKSVIDLIVEPITPLTYCQLVSDVFKLDEISNCLSIAAKVIDFIDKDIDNNDKIIAINTDRLVMAKYVFSPFGEFKKAVFNV